MLHTEPCKHHDIASERMSFNDWIDWCYIREAKGLKQTQCKKCHRPLFPEEVGKKKKKK